jgi:hypothetical protein
MKTATWRSFPQDSRWSKGRNADPAGQPEISMTAEPIAIEQANVDDRITIAIRESIKKHEFAHI